MNAFHDPSCRYCHGTGRVTDSGEPVRARIDTTCLACFDALAAACARENAMERAAQDRREADDMMCGPPAWVAADDDRRDYFGDHHG